MPFEIIVFPKPGYPDAKKTPDLENAHEKKTPPAQSEIKYVETWNVVKVRKSA